MDGKVVVITGAGSGIGRAAALRFAQAGAAVMGVGRTEQTLDETARLIRGAGGRAHMHVADAAAPAAATAVLMEAVHHFGGVDVLVNNAGVGYSFEQVRPGSMAALGETSPANWHEVMRINLDSVYYFCHAAIPEMRKRGGGAIVNVASTGGIRGMANAHTYSAAKGAIVNLTRSLAKTYAAQGIRSNVLAPGLVDTAMVAPVMSDDLLKVVNPMARAGLPEEIAAGIYFLAVDGTYCNGSVLVMDGGSSA